VKRTPPLFPGLATRGEIIHKILLRERVSGNYSVFSGRARSNNHPTATCDNPLRSLLSRIPGRARQSVGRSRGFGFAIEVASRQVSVRVGGGSSGNDCHGCGLTERRAEEC